MAYENETMDHLCKRIIKKLKKECKQVADGKPCAERAEVDFEDCCTSCQAARVLFGANDTIKELQPRAVLAERLGSFQRNVLDRVD